MTPTDNEPIEYLVLLPPEQAHQVELVATARAPFGTVDGRDIVREAVAEYLARLERPNTREDARPNRVQILFEYLFGGDEDQAFRRISEGVDAILDNAAILLDEAALLTGANRYERAEFLIGTAQEEMGKAYILLDMCRVDLARRLDVLRRLCRAFYDHVRKHVYFDLSAHSYPGIETLPEVQHYFRLGAQKWRQGSVEDGEPDMPNDTFFLREANLYVDVGMDAQSWAVPRHPAKSALFELPWVNPLDDALTALKKLQGTQRQGLFRAETLRILNGQMRGVSVTERTSLDELSALYRGAGEELEATVRVPLAAFKESQLHKWPMYWVIC